MKLGAKAYLQSRGGVWWFRRRVPPNLKAVLGRGEWRQSLRTRDIGEAQRRRNTLAVQTDREVAVALARLSGEVSEPLTRDAAVALSRDWLRDRLHTDEEFRLLGGPAWAANIDMALEETASDAREALAEMDWRQTAPMASELLEQSGRYYPPGDESVRLLAAELLKVRVQGHELLERRQRGEVVDAPAPSTVGEVAPAVTLGKLIDDYRKERDMLHGDESTTRKYSHVFRALREVLGADRDIRTITREDCRQVRDTLRRLPAHSTKRYPGLTLLEAIAAGESSGADTISATTLKTYMHNLSALLNWAVKEGWLPANPATGLMHRAEPSVRRRAFTPKELEVLFGSLAQFKEVVPWRFWLPALACFSGARANELCQLRVADVVSDGGATFLDFSAFDPEEGVRIEGKRLKTAGSERMVPVHPDVLAAGFLDYVAGRREAGAERLFPELPRGADGRFSAALSRWFARHLDTVGLSARALVFHSFRHGFADAARRAGLSEELANALGGWVVAGQRGRYGNRLEMARELGKISFAPFALPEEE